MRSLYMYTYSHAVQIIHENECSTVKSLLYMYIQGYILKSETTLKITLSLQKNLQKHRLQRALSVQLVRMSTNVSNIY